MLNYVKLVHMGFNPQKNQGMGLEHMFSENYTAMKNHYFLIQIGHMVAQFLEAGLRRLKALAKLPALSIFGCLKEAFRTLLLTDADYELIKQRQQYRFQ